jgi:hypothetical protein
MRCAIGAEYYIIIMSWRALARSCFVGGVGQVFQSFGRILRGSMRTIASSVSDANSRSLLRRQRREEKEMTATQTAISALAACFMLSTQILDRV